MGNNVISVDKIEIDSNGEINAIGKDQKYLIGHYNDVPIFAVRDMILYKKHLLNIVRFNKERCKWAVRFYKRDHNFLTDEEVITFNQLIDEGKNPFAIPELMIDFVEKAKTKGYVLSSGVIPEFIAYQSREAINISIEELKWLHDHIVISETSS